MSKSPADQSEKLKKGCLKAALHTLLFILGSGTFFTIGIKMLIAKAITTTATAASIFSLIGFGLSLIPAYIIFVVLWILIAYFIEKSIKKSKTKKEDKEYIEGTTLTKGDLKAILEEGKERVREINKFATSLDSAEMRSKIYDIGKTVEKIYENFKQDPKDIKKGKQFLNYYLDATLKILRKYEELSQHKQMSEEVKKSLDQVENSLDTIKTAFEKQLQKLVENDVLDVDVELQVLKSTLRAEGLE